MLLVVATPVTPSVPPTVALPEVANEAALNAPVVKEPAVKIPGTVKSGPAGLKVNGAMSAAIDCPPLVTPCAKAPPETKATTARAIRFFFITNSVNKNDTRQFVAVTLNEYL